MDHFPLKMPISLSEIHVILPGIAVIPSEIHVILSKIAIIPSEIAVILSEIHVILSQIAVILSEIHVILPKITVNSFGMDVILLKIDDSLSGIFIIPFQMACSLPEIVKNLFNTNLCFGINTQIIHYYGYRNFLSRPVFFENVLFFSSNSYFLANYSEIIFVRADKMCAVMLYVLYYTLFFEINDINSAF